MQTVEFRSMNTSVVLAAEGDAEVLPGLEATRSFIEMCEQRFSRFIPESEVSRLNASLGSWQKVSDDLLEILVQCSKFHRETGGLFDPAILPDQQRLGYDRSMDQIVMAGGAVGPAAVTTIKTTIAIAEMKFYFAGPPAYLPS